MKKHLLAIAVCTVFSTVSHAQFSQFQQFQNTEPHTSGGYADQQLQKQIQVERGIVLQVRKIEVQGSETGQVVGGLLGGLLGAVAARNTDDYAAKGVAATLGATLGAVGGKKFTGNSGSELIIQKQSGDVVSVTQEDDENTFSPGQYVIFVGGRVLHDMTNTFTR
jgi:outer membrane lipoprotein SlyB